MSLYDLRKKIQLLFSALPDEIDLLMREKITEILDEEITVIESRVSQLEKDVIPNLELDVNEPIDNIILRARVDELREVLGK